MSFASILGNIAPEIEAGLTLVGGPFGAVGAMAVKAAASVLTPGVTNPTASSIAAALSGATPEQMLALTKVNDEFKAKMQELKIDVLQIQQQQDATDAADRDSARKNFGILKYWPQLALTGLVTFALFGITIALLTKTVSVDATNQVLITTLLTALTAAFIQQMNFWFGSSHGSQKKDDALAQAAMS